MPTFRQWLATRSPASTMSSATDEARAEPLQMPHLHLAPIDRDLDLGEADLDGSPLAPLDLARQRQPLQHANSRMERASVDSRIRSASS